MAPYGFSAMSDAAHPRSRFAVPSAGFFCAVASPGPYADANNRSLIACIVFSRN